MPDYYSLLVQKIREAETDSGKLRELVYEAARLALKRHVNVHYPALSLQDGKRLLSDLEAAIMRLEAEVGGSIGRPVASREEKPRPLFAQNGSDQAAEAVLQEIDFFSMREGKSDTGDRSAAGSVRSQVRVAGTSDIAGSSVRGNGASQPMSAPRADVQRTFTLGNKGDSNGGIASGGDGSPAERHSDARPAVKSRPPQVGSELLDWPLAETSSEPEARDGVLLSDQPESAASGAAYPTRPNSFSPNRDRSYWSATAEPRKESTRSILIGVGVVSHIAVAILAGAAFYITMLGRTSAPPPVQDIGALPPQRPAKSSPVARLSTKAGLAEEPVITASLAAASDVPATNASLPDFPRPAAYGVYAISNGRLVELEQMAATPVDPRTRNAFQIGKPSRVVINDAKLSFIVYRRDVIANTSDKVSVRIAARIARAMTVDPLGKAVMEVPPTESWLIREIGYELRVLPVSESSEMVLLRAENDNFAFPPGRYELLFGGTAYDFVIAGNVRNAAHCVESVTTARGPVFYECRGPQ